MSVLSAVINFTKMFQKCSMETSYFTKNFYLEKDGFCIQRMNKKRVRKLKRLGKRLKATRKSHIDRKKNIWGILYEAGDFYRVQGIF